MRRPTCPSNECTIRGVCTRVSAMCIGTYPKLAPGQRLDALGRDVTLPVDPHVSQLRSGEMSGGTADFDSQVGGPLMSEVAQSALMSDEALPSSMSEDALLAAIAFSPSRTPGPDLTARWLAHESIDSSDTMAQPPRSWPPNTGCVPVALDTELVDQEPTEKARREADRAAWAAIDVILSC
jgi:hypothetical protein